MSAGHRREKVMFVALMILFALPVLVALGLHSFVPDWRPWGTSNNGTFVTPPREVSFTTLEASDGLSLDALRGKWILLVVGTDCSERCRALLHMTKQVQIALGREANRVARLYISNRDAALPSAISLVRENPGLRVATASSQWFKQMSLDRDWVMRADRVYIIDPRGYLMMEYPKDIDGGGIRTDLKRLLKASRGG